MASLLDTLKQRLSGAPQQAPAPVAAPVDIDAILKAKQGKAGSSVGPAASSQAAAAAQDIGTQQLAQQQQQGQMQAQQLAGQEAAVQQKEQLAKDQLASNNRLFQQKQTATAMGQRNALQGSEDLANMQRTAGEQLKTQELSNKATLALQELAAERNISKDNLFAGARMDRKELSQRQDAAELEQKAFLLSMSDKSYLDEINRIASQRQLQDNVAFNQEVSRLTFGDSMAKMLDEIGFQTTQNMDKRTLNEQLASLTNGQVIELANAAAQAANMQAAWTAGGTAISKVGEYYAKQPAPAAPAPGGV